MPDDTPNPSQGGSYARDPVTGALIPLGQPGEAQPALYRDPAEAAAAPAPAAGDSTIAAAPAAANTSPQPEA